MSYSLVHWSSNPELNIVQLTSKYFRLIALPVLILIQFIRKAMIWLAYNHYSSEESELTESRKRVSRLLTYIDNSSFRMTVRRYSTRFFLWSEFKFETQYLFVCKLNVHSPILRHSRTHFCFPGNVVLFFHQFIFSAFEKNNGQRLHDSSLFLLVSDLSLLRLGHPNTILYNGPLNSHWYPSQSYLPVACLRTRCASSEKPHKMCHGVVFLEIIVLSHVCRRA